MASPTAQAASATWDGGASTNELTTGTNWNPDAVPNNNGDTATWDGTQAGNLSLVWSANFGPSPGNSGGLNLSLTGTQSGSVSLDASSSSANLGLGNITIASGAGAFSLGNGSDTTNITLRTVSNSTFTNNSANTATFASDVLIGNGNAVNGRSMTFAGSGDWDLNASFAAGFGNLGTAAITKNNGGTLTIASSLGHGGATTVNGGTLKVTGSLTSSAVTVNTGAAVSLENAGAVNRTLTLNGTSTLTQTVDNAISGASGALNVQTSSVTTTTVTRPNNYSGQTTIGSNGGATVLRATASGALGSGSIFIPGNGGSNRLELANNITLGNALAVNGKGNTPDQPAGILNVSGANALNGTITVNTGGTYTTIRSDSGVLTLGAATALTSAATGVRGVLFTGDGDIEVSGAITNGNSSGMEIYKSGDGTLTLSGANPHTYSGPTAVSGGILVINGSKTGGGSVAVGSAGTLGGTGSIAGATAIAGALAPGNSVGTLTFTGSVDLTGGTYIVDYDPTGNGGLGSIDLAAIGGSLTLSSTTLNFSAVAAGALTQPLYTFATFAPSTLGSFVALNVPSGYVVQASATSLELAAIPEASSLLFGAVAAAFGGAGYLRRRRQGA
ncbi:MAG: autotransporter-associated beta strand repeat-containing protein [Pirellulales bacterium]|nr:autotransporter-associated beta strand repeat-containing protein [Pirellulales bacterium]